MIDPQIFPEAVLFARAPHHQGLQTVGRYCQVSLLSIFCASQVSAVGLHCIGEQPCMDRILKVSLRAKHFVRYSRSSQQYPFVWLLCDRLLPLRGSSHQFRAESSQQQDSPSTLVWTPQPLTAIVTSTSSWARHACLISFRSIWR